MCKNVVVCCCGRLPFCSGRFGLVGCRRRRFAVAIPTFVCCRRAVAPPPPPPPPPPNIFRFLKETNHGTAIAISAAGTAAAAAGTGGARGAAPLPSREASSPASAPSDDGIAVDDV